MPDLESAAATLHELDRHTSSSDEFGGGDGQPLADDDPELTAGIPFLGGHPPIRLAGPGGGV